MADATTLKDVVKELKETNKKNDKLLRETGKFQKATQGTGGFLSSLAQRTEGVPLLGGFFKDIDETVGKMQDGISATKRLIGIGGDETNKLLAEANGMSLKDFKRIEKMEATEQAKQANQEAVLNTLLEGMKLTEALTDEQKKMVSAVSQQEQVQLLKSIRELNEKQAEFGENVVNGTDELIKKTVELGKDLRESEAKRIEQAKDSARESNVQQMSMRERMSEMFSSFKDKVGAAKGIGGKASAVMKEGGEMMKNMFGEMFGTLGATALMSMSGLTKSFAKGVAGMLRGIMTRALAFMSPPVLIAMAVVGILAFFKDDIIKWFKKMWSAITGYFENINWKEMFKTAFKVIFAIPLMMFKLGTAMWSAITGFFDGFSLEDMMSKLGDISIVKYIMDLKDKIVNGLKSFILNIVPETFFKYPLRKKVAEMMGVTLSGGGQVDSTEAATSSTSPFVDKSAVVDANFANTLNENALAKTGSKGATNIVTSKGGDQVVTNQNVTHTSTSIGNPDPVYGKFLYGV